MKALLSAYACEPGLGSEPGVGWNYAVELARRHDVWVITRANNRPVIERELVRRPIPRLRFVYYDLPDILKRWKRGPRGVQPYYYAWQLGIYGVARRLHRAIRFDFSQHVTFVKYWSPSLLSALPIPFVWGPVGGGEGTPWSFLTGMSARGKTYECLRVAARGLAERDPLVRMTARRSALALGSTEETARRLRRLGAREVHTLSQVALPDVELEEPHAPPEKAVERPIRFISMGNLLSLKGFDLGVKAFAKADLPGSEYEIVGGGPEAPRLRRLVDELGIAGSVLFTGQLPRAEALARLQGADVLVHPSLHDSGGWTIVEALAAGKPVICLDRGGPAELATPACGFIVAAREPSDAVRGVCAAMSKLAHSWDLRSGMAAAARMRAQEARVSARVGTVLNLLESEARVGR